MQLKDLNLSQSSTKIFSVVDSENENPLEWTIEPTKLEIIPSDEGHFIVIAKQVDINDTEDCYIDVITSERISELVVKIKNKKIIIEDLYEQEISIIPGVASDCFGVYDSYYSRENPQVGIDILKNGLIKSKEKSAIAEDLGYIFRDENRLEEAIESFLISEQNNPSSEYIYFELAQLYNEIGQKEKQAEYERKFEQNQ